VYATTIVYLRLYGVFLSTDRQHTTDLLSY